MSLRKWVVGFFCVLGVLFSLGAVAALLWGDGAGRWLGGDRVGILALHGPIDNDADFLRELREFRADESIRAIVVDIDSPGGAVAPSQSIYEELGKLRRDEIPVVASISSVGASGGYYVALAADTILALPGSMVGSIGVILEFPNAADLLDRVGVRMETIKSSEHKDIGSPFRDVTAGERELLQSMISDVYEQFVAVVAHERSLPEARVRALADGRVMSGRQAVRARLIDRSGNLPDAIAVAGRMAGLGDDPETVVPPEPGPSLLDVVLGGETAALAGRLRSVVSPTHGPSLRYQAR